MDFDAQTILLAEDNEDDVFIFTRAFRQTGARNPIQLVSDGQEVIDYLAGSGKFVDRARFPLPAVVLLDLKLPLCHGLEVLEWIHARPHIASIPAVVLTSSAERRDLNSASALGARFYLVKPPRTATLAKMMGVLRAEWSGVPAASPKLDGDLLVDFTPLREVRAERLLSIRELASLAGVAPSTIYLIESGRSTPRPAVARLIAEALDVAPQDVAEFRRTILRHGRPPKQGDRAVE